MDGDGNYSKLLGSFQNYITKTSNLTFHTALHLNVLYYTMVLSIHLSASLFHLDPQVQNGRL